LTLFLVAVGVYLDWRTLRDRGHKLADLADGYKLTETRYAAGYLSGAVGALFVIGQQLQSGHAQVAIAQIIKSVPILLPPPPGH
jgi:hypothetical protein